MAAEDVKPASSAVTKLEKNFSQIILTLENVLIAPEKVAKTPSTDDGLDAETEKDLRILGTELIQIAGMLLKLPQTAMATGCVLFQRFYYSKSFVRHTMEIVAMGCTNLAAKIEEAPRRPRDVINVFHHIKQVRAGRTISPLVLNQDYITLKNNVIKAERRVLKELGFCVHVKHPHKMIIMYLEILNCKNNKLLVQKAWNYMNDSLRTNVFVRYSPETIACACVYLAARQLEIALPNRPHWFLIFDATEEDVQDISMTVLSLYNRPKVSYDALEKIVNDVKQIHTDAKAKAKGFSAGAIKEEALSPSSTPATPNKKNATSTNAALTSGAASASKHENSTTPPPPSSGALGRALMRLKKEKEEDEDSVKSFDPNQENHNHHNQQQQHRDRDHHHRKDGRAGAGKDSRSRKMQQQQRRGSSHSRSSSRSPVPRRPRSPSNSRSPSPAPVNKSGSAAAGGGGPSPKLPRSYLSPRMSRSPNNNVSDGGHDGSAGHHRRGGNNNSSQSPSPKRPKKHHQQQPSPTSGSKKDRPIVARDAISAAAAAAAASDDKPIIGAGGKEHHRSRSRPQVGGGGIGGGGGGKRSKDLGGGRNANDVAESYYQERMNKSGGGGGREYSPRSPRSPSGGDYSPNYNRNKKTSSSKKTSASYYKDSKDRNYIKIGDEFSSSSSSKDRSGSAATSAKSKKSHKNGHSKERYGRDGDYGRDYYRDDIYAKHKR